MASKYFERSRSFAVFVVFSQLLLSECVPLPNATNEKHVEEQIKRGT